MTYRQLHYTSCEKGLTGRSGFQFSAATPGTSAEAMRRVEALAGYEAPRWLGPAPTPGQIAACPVNLCYIPGGQPVIVRVVYVGADYSGRLGNYFAHALVADRAPDVLPIQLWGAGIWRAAQADRPELPHLDGPLSTGPLTRSRIDEFLRDNGGLPFLPALLTAVDLAVHEGRRSVVILDRDADRVACWIAAISYLLPPATVRDMSFATYEHRPRFSRHHVIGTVPEADFAVTDTALESFYVFDFVGMRASEVPAEPLARHLAGDRTLGAAPLWERARTLADGSEHRLASWYPVVLAVDLLSGRPISGSAAGVLTRWLVPARSRLPAAEFEALSHGVLGESRPDAVAELVLRDLAASGPRELTDWLELISRHRVSLDPHTLRRLGFDRVGPWLLDRVEPEIVGASLADQPLIRDGALRFLAAVPGERLLPALAAGLKHDSALRDLAGHPRLAEAITLVETAERGERPGGSLLTVAGGLLSGELLGFFWRERKWTLDEAVAVLGEGAVAVRVARPWLESLIDGGPHDHPGNYARLCRALEVAVQPDEEYTEPTVSRLAVMHRVLEREHVYRTPGRDSARYSALDDLITGYEHEYRPAREYLRLRLPALLLTLPPRMAIRALQSAPGVVQAAFADAVDHLLTGHGEGRPVGAAAELFAVAWQARRALPELARAVEERLALTLRGWRRKDLAQVGRLVADLDEGLEAAFESWRRRRLGWLPPPVRRLVRRLGDP
uniref:GTPase-associated protein 1-related protein n=1 Tax=Herbidospora sakaeratensis TaxID=564415 RepID=UPI001FE0BE81|nr:GTPase-associated protein 1-related protein [Herbidospora sakaeratensis]